MTQFNTLGELMPSIVAARKKAAKEEMSVRAVRPPPEHRDKRWHWLDTEHGPMCASWFPLIGKGTWDISGHTFDCDSLNAIRMEYLGPAIPPERH